MVSAIKPQELAFTIKFGGGLHTRASEDEIDLREAADGENFLLDLENRELRNRPPFDKVGTVPNGQEIRGGGSLLKSDGSVSTLVQAGSQVYEWDGTDFTGVGAVNNTARLRGHWRSHNFTLDDKLLLTDLNLAEPVKEWDGTTFQSVAFTDEDTNPFGNFFAKYLSVSNERAVFAHVRDANVTTRHMMVGSKRGDFTQITIANRPSNAISEEDPFFLLTPDLKPINGHVEAFGTTVLSTERGQIVELTGASAQEFAFKDFYPGSNASGEESLAYIGNDVIYGRQGRVESVTDTDRFGDAETDDLTKQIADAVEDFTGWRTVYNSRLNRVYLFPEGQSEVRVVQTSMLRGQLSPWMKWTTAHSIAMQPSFVMAMLDPQDGLEYTFMGDASGNFYRLEGTGSSGDGGANAITTEWLTGLLSAPLDAQAYRIEGYLKYRKSDAAAVTITLEYAGETAFNQSINLDLPAIANRPVYSGGLHYNDDNYYSTAFDGRLIRQPFFAPGQGNEFQVRVQVEGATDFQINEIGLRFLAAS